MGARKTEFVYYVGGKKMTFSEEEIMGILSEYFSDTVSKTVDVIFKINPLEIDRDLFDHEREDYDQEQTRLIIKKAFEELDDQPDMYGRSFETIILEKTWKTETGAGLVKMAKKKGDHLADWVEQAFEWAQKIQNGETWEDLCNENDNSDFYRIVKWYDETYRLVGGSRLDGPLGVDASASDISEANEFMLYYQYDCAVPLVVRYQEISVIDNS